MHQHRTHLGSAARFLVHGMHWHIEDLRGRLLHLICRTDSAWIISKYSSIAKLNSSNTPLDRNDLSRDLYRLTACERDSPSGFA